MTTWFQVNSISSVVLYGSNEACSNTVNCCTTIVSLPCNKRRILSQNDRGGEGSLEGADIFSKPIQFNIILNRHNKNTNTDNILRLH